MLRTEIAALDELDLDGVRSRWRKLFQATAPPHLPKYLLFRILAYLIQANALGDLDRDSMRYLDRVADDNANRGVQPGHKPGKVSPRYRLRLTIGPSSPAPYWFVSMRVCCTGW
jgi:hypothetical protein